MMPVLAADGLHALGDTLLLLAAVAAILLILGLVHDAF